MDLQTPVLPPSPAPTCRAWAALGADGRRGDRPHPEHAHRVDPLAGNFTKAIAQVKPNLPQMTNPVQATVRSDPAPRLRVVHGCEARIL